MMNQNNQQKHLLPGEEMYIVFLEELKNRFRGRAEKIFQIIVESGVSEECEAKRLVVDEFIHRHNECISEDTVWDAIKLLIGMGLFDTVKVSTGFRNFKILNLTDLGRYFYHMSAKKEVPIREHERIVSEHASLEHGYMIKDVKKVLEKREKYYSITTGRKENRIELEAGKAVILDVIARPCNGQCEFYEVELGTHTHDEFSAKCNKLLKITSNINIVSKNRDRITRILVPQIEWWIKKVGIGVLRGIGEKVTVYSIMDLARGKPTYRLDLNTGKMVCCFKPEKEENG